MLSYATAWVTVHPYWQSGDHSQVMAKFLNHLPQDIADTLAVHDSNDASAHRPANSVPVRLGYFGKKDRNVPQVSIVIVVMSATDRKLDGTNATLMRNLITGVRNYWINHEQRPRELNVEVNFVTGGGLTLRKYPDLEAGTEVEYGNI